MAGIVCQFEPGLLPGSFIYLHLNPDGSSFRVCNCFQEEQYLTHSTRCLLCTLLFLPVLFVGAAGIKTPAKTVIYSADASEYCEEPPEQRPAKNMCQLRLGVWKQVYSPCREKAAGNYTYVAKYNQTDAPGLIAYVD